MWTVEVVEQQHLGRGRYRIVCSNGREYEVYYRGEVPKVLPTMVRITSRTSRSGNKYYEAEEVLDEFGGSNTYSGRHQSRNSQKNSRRTRKPTNSNGYHTQSTTNNRRNDNSKGFVDFVGIVKAIFMNMFSEPHVMFVTTDGTEARIICHKRTDLEKFAISLIQALSNYFDSNECEEILFMMQKYVTLKGEGKEEDSNGQDNQTA